MKNRISSPQAKIGSRPGLDRLAPPTAAPLGPKRSTGLSAVRPIPRRGLSREEAAMYLGISASKFDELVRDGRMPSPKRIDGRKIWDIRDLDVAFDALPGEIHNRKGPVGTTSGSYDQNSPSVRGPVRGPPRPCAPLLSSPWRQAAHLAGGAWLR